MTQTVTIDCSCGRRIEVSDPGPGGRIRCPSCGRDDVAGGAADRAGAREAPGIPPAAREELGSLLEGLRPEDLACSACGAIMAVALRDDGRKIAVCEPCGRRTGLSARRGTAAGLRRAS